MEGLFFSNYNFFVSMCNLDNICVIGCVVPIIVSTVITVPEPVPFVPYDSSTEAFLTCGYRFWWFMWKLGYMIEVVWFTVLVYQFAYKCVFCWWYCQCFTTIFVIDETVYRHTICLYCALLCHWRRSDVYLIAKKCIGISYLLLDGYEHFLPYCSHPCMRGRDHLRKSGHSLV